MPSITTLYSFVAATSATLFMSSTQQVTAEVESARNMFQACRDELNEHCKGLPAGRMQCIVGNMDKIKSDECRSWIQEFKTCMEDPQLKECVKKGGKKKALRMCVAELAHSPDSNTVGAQCTKTKWYESVLRSKHRSENRKERIAAKKEKKRRGLKNKEKSQ